MSLKRLAAFFTFLMLLTISVFAYENADIKDEYTFDGLSLTEYAEISDVPATAGYSAYVINLDTGTVVYTKKCDDIVYPASSAKLMTAIIAYENIPDLNVAVTASAEAVKAASGTNIAIKPGETFTAKDLLNAVLVYGANDAAIVLAEYVSGDVASFCELMNDKASELGAENTHFDNVTGFHVETTVTTARDMAKIAKHLYYIDELFEMSNTTRYSIEPTNMTKDKRTLINRNVLISRIRSTEYYVKGAKGMSLGSTPEGGQCVASAFTSSDNLTYLAVVMNSKEIDGVNYACHDIESLFAFCAKTFSLQTVASTNDVMCEIPVKLAVNTDHLTLFPAEDLKVLLPKELDYTNDITIERRVYSDAAKAPVYKGDEFGEIVLLYKKSASIGRTKLVAGMSVDRSNILYFLNRIEIFVSGTWFKVFLTTALVLFALYFALSVAYRVRRDRYYTSRRRRR